MKLISIINNYEGRTQEMGLNITPDNRALLQCPIYHIKPDTAMLRNNDSFYLPHFDSSFVAECELVVKISRVVKSIEERFASRCYDQIGLAVSFTAADLQRQAISASLPWEAARSFDKSTAISPNFLNVSDLSDDLSSFEFQMKINGSVAQSAKLSDMLFSIDQIVSYVSQFVTLKIGDLILCGTSLSAPTVERDQIVSASLCSASLGNTELLNFEIK